MLSIVHLGGGGKYANYLKEAAKRISRLRPIQVLTATPTGTKSFRVAVHASGEPLTREELTNLMARDDIAFIIGDSRGIRPEVLSSCHAVYSVSPLPVSHQIEAAILAEQIEQIAVNGQ